MLVAVFEYRPTPGVHHVWCPRHNSTALDDECEILTEVEGVVVENIDS
jgi:hypothetical protein